MPPATDDPPQGAWAATAQFASSIAETPPTKKSNKTVSALKATWKFTTTPLGFCIVVYGANVVAWGGMLFLLLCGAAPAMCYPAQTPGVKDCNSLDSPRRIWIETDSQILTALFCVTGFGLIYWRARDLYYLLRFRLRGDRTALRTLAGFHKSWFRLPIEDDDAVVSVADDTPRAPATPLWKMDYVVWCFIWNTIFQAVLCGVMWGMNRFTRPSWSTGLFVALGCIIAALGGLMQFQEGKKVKKVERVNVGGEKERPGLELSSSRDGDRDVEAEAGLRGETKSKAGVDGSSTGDHIER